MNVFMLSILIFGSFHQQAFAVGKREKYERAREQFSLANQVFEADGAIGHTWKCRNYKTRLRLKSAKSKVRFFASSGDVDKLIIERKFRRYVAKSKVTFREESREWRGSFEERIGTTSTDIALRQFDEDTIIIEHIVTNARLKLAMALGCGSSSMPCAGPPYQSYSIWGDHQMAQTVDGYTSCKKSSSF